MERGREVREPKTTPEQWRLIVSYMELHPILLKNKFNNADGHQEQKRVWEDLATHLNSMGVGGRPVAKWQAAIGRWKSKTKAKASAIRVETQRTGGGPLNVPALNNTEQRLMSLLGTKSVTGDLNTELGNVKPIVITQTTRQQTGQLQAVAGPSYERSPSPPPLVPLSSIENLIPVNEREDTHTTSQRKRPQVTHVPPSKKRVRTTGEKTRRFVNTNRMHEEMIAKLTNIEKNTGILASSMMEVSKDFKKYINHMIANTSDQSD